MAAREGLYDAKRLSAWLTMYHTARALGVPLSKVVGFQNCEDGVCGVDRSRWECATRDGRTYYRCRQCKRFIGY